MTSGLSRSFNVKVLALALFTILSLTALDWFHELYIQFILVVWNIAMVLFIIVWEKEKRRKQVPGQDFTNDEDWTRVKKELESIDNRISKTLDLQKRRNLLARRLFLVNELRRLEWAIRESNINEMYNAQNGNLKKIGQESKKKLKELGRTSGTEESGEEMEQIEKREADYLNKFVKNMECVLKKEPADSLRLILKPSVNELKAHYNMLKQRNPYSGSLTNVWTVWALASGIVEQGKLDRSLTKYASKPFQPKIETLIRIVEKRGVLTIEEKARIDRRDSNPT
ncbi:MAG: hypothetical protein JRN20_20975 [Nitrososphaerota archaeon]|nr:hypothetical protein [Nitrososphaerota archaeon]